MIDAVNITVLIELRRFNPIVFLGRAWGMKRSKVIITVGDFIVRPWTQIEVPWNIYWGLRCACATEGFGAYNQLILYDVYPCPPKL